MKEEKLVLKNAKKMNAGDSDIYRSITLTPKSHKPDEPEPKRLKRNHSRWPILIDNQNILASRWQNFTDKRISA